MSVLLSFSSRYTTPQESKFRSKDVFCLLRLLCARLAVHFFAVYSFCFFSLISKPQRQSQRLQLFSMLVISLICRSVESYKSASQRAMRAKGRAMRAMRAMRVMRVTVKMLRIFICNIYKRTPDRKHRTLPRKNSYSEKNTAPKQSFQTDEIQSNLFASPCRF